MFDFSKVRSVYSGRKGCMCGCNGRHTYSSKFQVEATKDRGYAVDSGEVNDRTVKTLTNKVARLLADSSGVKHVYFDPDYVAVDMANDRTYCLYFAD